MKNMAIPKRSTLVVLAILLAIIGLGAFLRFYQIGKLSFWVDEVATFITADAGILGVLRRIRNDPNMSLFYLLAHFWMKLYPAETEGQLRSLAAIFSIFSIPATFAFARALVDDRKKGNIAGLIAALFVALSASNIQYGQDFRSYSLFMFLAVLSSWWFIELVKAKTPNWWRGVVYILIGTAGFYAHFFFVFTLLVHFSYLVYLLISKRFSRQLFYRYAVNYVAIAILCLPIAIFAMGKGSLIAWISEPSLANIGSFVVSLSGTGSIYTAALMVLLAFFGGLYAIFAKDSPGFQSKWRFGLTIACLFTAPIITLTISLFSVNVFLARYLFYVSPFYATLIGYGFVLIYERIIAWGWRSIVAKSLTGLIFVLFAVILIKGDWMYYRSFKQEDLRSAGPYISEHCSDKPIVFYPAWYRNSFKYYVPDIVNGDQGTVIVNTDTQEIVYPQSQKPTGICVVIRNPDNVLKNEDVGLMMTIFRRDYLLNHSETFYGVGIYVFGE